MLVRYLVESGKACQHNIKMLGFSMGQITFRVKDIVPQLMAYGEEEAAEKLEVLSEDDLLKVGELAFNHYLVPKTILDKAICLGVIEHLEGCARELRRKRRIFKKT